MLVPNPIVNVSGTDVYLNTQLLSEILDINLLVKIYISLSSHSSADISSLLHFKVILVL